MRTLYLLVFSFLFVATDTCYSQSSLELEKLTDSIQSILRKEHIPGAFVTVVSKDSILFKRGFGYADVVLKKLTTPQHLFKIGSISKTFTILAIMKLVEQGKLSLDTKLADIAPEIPFENEWEATHPVKVKHLMEHKAGFDDTHFNLISKKRTNDMTAFDEAMEFKDSFKSRWKPGFGFAYSNTGCIILGYLIEKITKQRYQDYIKNEVLLPLKMNSTDFGSAFSDTLSSDNFAIGYGFVDDAIEKSRDVNIICEAIGTLLSNADDMSYFLQFLLNKKTPENNYIVSESTIDNMETLHGDLEIENNITNGHKRYGLGIDMRAYGTKNIPFLGHGGDIHGFSSLYIYNRTLDLGIAISRNTKGSNKKLIKLLVDTFTNTVEKETIKSNIDGTQLLDWEGEYKLVTSRMKIAELIIFPFKTVTINVSKEKVSLTRFLNDKKEVYINKKGNAFTKNKHRIPSLHFLEKDDKKYVSYKNDIYEPVSSFGFLIFRIALGLSLLLGVIAILTVFIQSILTLFKKIKKPTLKRNLILGLPMVLLFLSVIITSYFVFSFKYDMMIGQLNLVTIFVLLLTSLYPVASVWTTYWFFRNRRSMPNKFLKIYYVLVITGGLFLSVYCIYHGWFMKLMWV